MSVREISCWIRPINVRPAMEYLSRWVAYDFDEWDWQAVSHGLTTTSWDDERWYSYPIVGSPALTVFLTRSVDADPVGIRVTGDLDDTLHTRIETLLELLADLSPES